MDFVENVQPVSTATDQVWFKPSNDHFHISDLAGIWFLSDFTNGTVATALTLPDTGYTSAIYIGQYNNANAAANAIPTADYSADIQYCYYDRSLLKVRYLSAYVAPGSQVEYWDIVHVLTDENRITPHPFGAAITVTPTAGDFGATAVQLPEEGWIEVVGSIDDGSWDFSVRVPVTKIRVKDASIDGGGAEASNSLAFQLGITSVDYIAFGYTAAGILLVASETAGTIAAQVYV